jgi:hypothetical protein
MFLWSFCDGFFAFPAIGFSIGGSSIPGLVPAGVLELIEQLSAVTLIEIMASFQCSGWVSCCDQTKDDEV